MEDAIREMENDDGVRLTWNIWPNKTVDSNMDKVPVTVLYSPIEPTAYQLEEDPVFCENSGCRSIINPNCDIDFISRKWTCIFCKKVMPFPAKYRDLSSENLAPELSPRNSTIEYKLTKKSIHLPVFVFLIDVCVFDKERLEILRKALIVVLDSLPSNALISVIRFGTNVEFMQIDRDKIVSLFVFKGDVEYSKEVVKYLNIKPNRNEIPSTGLLVYKKEYYHYLHEMFSKIEADPFPVKKGNRNIRCTGSAISFATSFLGALVPDSAGKIVLFTQGPCTFGPGAITSIELKESIRGHSEIIKNNCFYTNPAMTFYKSIGERLSSNGHGIDILSTTLYDIGLYEMKVMIDLTGGMIVMAQDFNSDVYLTSCGKIFSRDRGDASTLNQVFNAKMRILSSKGMRLKNVLGQGIKTGPGWRIPILYPSHNILFVMEQREPTNEEHGFIQILTQYQKSNRDMIIRVTTICRFFTEPVDEKMAIGFDQGAACIFLARSLTCSSQLENDMDLVRRIDRWTIRFMKNYSVYSRNNADSVILPNTMEYFPNFCYFLRRSLVIRTESNSPDETAYYRNLISRENVGRAMTLIVPTLQSFHYQGEILPAEMDSKSLKGDVILLLDNFHNILIWKGEYIAQWFNEGLHEKKEFEFLNDFYKNVLDRAKNLIKERVPTPKFIECEKGSSQERFLLSKINPSQKSQEQVISDDIDFDKFYESLCKIIVEG